MLFAEDFYCKHQDIFDVIALGVNTLNLGYNKEMIPK